MFRLLFDLVRTVIFMIAVTVAFVAGGIVFNLDRLGNLDVQILKYKKFLPGEIKAVLPGQDMPYTRPRPKMTMTGRVLEVYDGDTLTVLAGQNKFRVRLFGVDAPEVLQEYGIPARDRLRELILGQTVTVEVLNVDQYGRAVAILRKNLQEINTEMVRSGAAWHYVQYAAGETGLADAQKEAKNAKTGIWQNNNPVPPWDYRKQTQDSTI
ncbi:MAG: thermonuclease family protein [Lentisphaeria bacterium]|nr:thermonuclease family protein [Lentisphaeria bacterium]